MRLRVPWAAALVVVSGSWLGCAGEQRAARDGASIPSERPSAGRDGGDAVTRRRAPEKLVAIDLSRQRLMLYEDGRLVREMTVSTGRRGKTPTGEFRIWRKDRLKDMGLSLGMQVGTAA